MDDSRTVEEREAFKEKLRSISFNFVGGGGYGRKEFHERTNAEFLREYVGEEDIKSGKVVSHHRWV